jgi:hypothetical protein
MAYIDEYGVKRPSAEYGEAHTALLYTPARIRNAINDFKAYCQNSDGKIRINESDEQGKEGLLAVYLLIDDELAETVKKRLKPRFYDEDEEDHIYDQTFASPGITWTARWTRRKDLLRTRHWYTDVEDIYGEQYVNDLIAGKTKKAPPYAPEYIEILQNIVRILKKNALRYDEK